MSRTAAIHAIRSMREAVEEGNLQLASFWAVVYMAEDQAAEYGKEMRLYRENHQNDREEVGT